MGHIETLRAARGLMLRQGKPIEDVAGLDAGIAALELLKNHQWVRGECDEGGHCLVDGCSEDTGHRSDCRLAALVKAS